MSGEVVNASTQLLTDIDLVNAVVDKWTEWDSNREESIAKFREIEAYKYATDTSSLPNTSNAFTHSVHLPLVAPISQDLEAIMMQVVMPHEDYFSFEPGDAKEGRVAQRKAVTSYIRNRNGLNGFVDVMAKLRSDYVTYGNAFAQVSYVNNQTQDKEGYAGPVVSRISPYDIAFDPTAPNFVDTPKIIREIVSPGELKKRGMNRTFDENIIDDILMSRGISSSSDAGTDKNEQYVPLGFGTFEQYISSGFIELLWFYGDLYDPSTNTLLLNRKIVVADGGKLILDEEISTVTGKAHIYKAGWQVLPDNLWAMGPLENIVGLNHQINHRENAKDEALDRLIYPDRVYIGDVEEMYDEDTGQTTYLAPENGGVNELSVNTQFFSFDLQIDRLKQEARTAARLPGDLTGFRSQGEKTALEFSALTDGGMRGFIDKAADFERNILEKVLMAELELAHDNFQDAVNVPNTVDGGFIETLSISKKDLAVNGVLKAMGARRFARKNQVLASLIQVSNTGLLQVAAPHISGKAAAKLIAELIEVQDTGLIEEFAQVTEQGEMQELSNAVEQQVAAAAQRPSLEEEQLNQQISQLDQGIG